MTHEHGGETAHGHGNLLIVWNESYDTGLKIIDEQHRGIVSIINSLHHALFVRDDESLLRPVAEMIMGYTKIHFTTEVEMLSASSYPRLPEHLARHDHLIAEADRIFLKCLKDGGEATPFLNFLKEWWVVHITREDMGYRDHLTAYLHSPRPVIIKRS
jgi:hemerythrin-like metal-binding protein